MNGYSWLTGTVMVAALATNVGATPPAPIDQHAATPVVMTAADSLDQLMDKWYEATLAGNDSQANSMERDLVRLLNQDIARTQERLAKSLDKTKVTQPESTATLAKADSAGDPLHDSAEFLRSNLNVKRLLLEAIGKTDAFSNKYRLLGDYVDLLRREVGLPKLKLAAEKHIEAQKN